MDIYLVRHGEAAASWGQSSDPGLSEPGMRQAEQAAQTLALELDTETSRTIQLVSSPLLRARQTAQPLADTLGAPVAVNPVFSEIPAPVPLPQRQDWLRQFMQQKWSEQNGELHRWRDAACSALLELECTTVIFTHFLVINAVVGQVMQRADTLCFWPDNASITRIQRAGERLQLVSLGTEMPTIVN